MKVYEPKQTADGKWVVEVSHYPESRTIETYVFDDGDQASDFYLQNNRT